MIGLPGIWWTIEQKPSGDRQYFVGKFTENAIWTDEFDDGRQVACGSVAHHRVAVTTCPNTQRNVNSRQQRANQIAVKRPQTSAKTSNLNQKWSGIRNKISESIHNSTFGSGYLQNRFHDVMDSLPSWRQSYHRVSWKSAGDWMRNTVNLLKCPILQWRGKWKSDPESVSGIGSPPKVSKFFWLVGPSITTSFNEIGSLLLQYCCTEAEWQARSSHRMTDGPHWSHNVRLGCVHYQLWSTLSCRALTGQ